MESCIRMQEASVEGTVLCVEEDEIKTSPMACGCGRNINSGLKPSLLTGVRRSRSRAPSMRSYGRAVLAVLVMLGLPSQPPLVCAFHMPCSSRLSTWERSKQHRGVYAVELGGEAEVTTRAVTGRRRRARSGADMAIVASQASRISRGAIVQPLKAVISHDHMKSKGGQLKEVGKSCLPGQSYSVGGGTLTASEEMVLVRRVHQLSMFNEVRSVLTTNLGRAPEEGELAAALCLSVKDLRHQIEVSQLAQTRLVMSNLGLIVHVAQKYFGNLFNQEVSYRDIIQEGSLALLHAAEKFKPSLGFRFSTYAGWWVRQKIQLCIAEQTRPIRLPQHVHEFVRTMTESHRLLWQDLGRPPTEEELAKHMGVSLKKVHFYSNCPETSFERPPAGDVEIGVSSDLRGNGGASGGAQTCRLLPKAVVDEGSLTPEEQVDKEMFRDNLEELMSVLNSDERRVMTLRYGLGGGEPTTLVAVAALSGTTTDRVRSMEIRALNKLRQLQRNCRLRGHVLE